MQGQTPAGQSPLLDLKATIDWLTTVDWAHAAGFALLALTLWLLLTSRVAKRVMGVAEETVFANWRLALLAATGLVLSLASGWTTWDGMRNFTREPILSFMITFGIQGVMLIVAWLIGESFASGMNVRASDSERSGFGKGMQATLGALIGVMLFIAVVMFGPFTSVAPGGGLASGGWGEVGDKLLIVVVGLLAAALIVVYASSDLVRPYLQSSRVILRNTVLWVMFLACMATSVFFSFDSLFSTIFPQDERRRAAEIRAVNQVASVVSDIGTLATRRQIEEAKSLFESEPWARYEAVLDKVQELARRAPDEVRKQLTMELEAQRSRIAKLEEQRASAEAGQAGLVTKKSQLGEEISRLQAERPDSAARTLEHKTIVADLEKRYDEQRTRTLAEEKGVEGSGKVGRGQFYRASKEEEAKLQAELQVARERLKSHDQRLTGIDRRLAQAKAELAQIDGDLAKLKGEADTAGQMIAVAQSGGPSENAERYDPASGVAALVRDRQTFRQKPEQETLAAIQTQCAALVGASTKVVALREVASGIDCNPKQATEAAARVFALNTGIKTFEANCAGGDKLPQGATTDTLLEFGRKCLQDSGLPSKDLAQMGATLSAVALNRDDKAHRFVVTWNAFQDGNRLAYLALAIAIAIDALIFMSGLFGANAVRSPLSDVPSMKARSAQQLEAIIENALIPDKLANAHAVLEAMQPITPIDGFTQEVVLPYHDAPSRGRVLKVLNAAATIGAVARDPNRPERYLVRPELFEFLSVVAKKAFDADESHARLAELKQVVTVALQPHTGYHAEIVLDHMHPINEKDGFSSEVTLSTVPSGDLPLMRKVLNSGAMLRFVSHDTRRGEEDRFYVHKDLYKTLAMIAASAPRTAGSGQLGAPHPAPPRGARHGGRLDSDLPRIVRDDKRALSSPARQLPGKPQAARESGESAEAHEARIAFLRDLVAAIGIEADSYLTLQGKPMGAAIAAGDAFDRARRSSRQLDAELEVRDERARTALDNQYKVLMAHLRPDDTLRRNALELAQREIETNWRAIMLLPAGPYEQLLQELLDTLEPQSGDGLLPPEGEDLLRRVKHLYRALGRSHRGTTEEWEELVASLDA
ncbi:MAG: hypothetical protein AB1749_03780, partial [Pseudomonadota bacterium]